MPTGDGDRNVLRELARQVAEIAALPVQRETIALWKALNRKRPARPMVMIDQIPWHEMDVDHELALQCTDDWCRQYETQLRRTLYRWKHMRVDFVVEPTIQVPMAIRSTGFGYERRATTVALDARNDVVGQAYADQITTDEDIEKIHAPQISHDGAATAAAAARAYDIFDGLLEVQVRGALPWYAPWDILVQWRNPEGVLYDLADRPDFLKRLARRLTDAHLNMLDQMEEQGLLGYGQSWIHCTGAFTDELPAPGFDAQKPRARDLWTFGMSQIFSTVSPAMHEEFERPFLGPWFERFGLCYYGCCEPLDQKVEMIHRLPNVRKVSMSPFVDAARGAEALGGDFVYSRKPSPALLAVDDFSLDAVERELRTTIDACRRHGCPLELILKDISTARYQPQRLWQWADLAMRLVRE